MKLDMHKKKSFYSKVLVVLIYNLKIHLICKFTKDKDSTLMDHDKIEELFPIYQIQKDESSLSNVISVFLDLMDLNYKVFQNIQGDHLIAEYCSSVKLVVLM
jgi:hypothetical protein